MPKPIAADKEAIRSTLIASGSIKETALLHGLKPATIRKWIERDPLFWPTATNANKLRQKADEILETKREAGHGDVVRVSHSADALAVLMEQKKGEIQTGLAKATANAAVAASELDGLSALEYSRKLSDLSAVYGRLFPEKQDSAQLNVNILSLSVDALRPVVDI